MTDSGSFDAGDLICAADLNALNALVNSVCATAGVAGSGVSDVAAGAVIAASHVNSIVAAYQRAWDASANLPGTRQAAVAAGGLISGALFQNLWIQLGQMVFNAFSHHRVKVDTSALGAGNAEVGELEFYENSTLIPQANGAAIGDMTAGSGLAAAFDGGLEATGADCARSSTTIGYIGKSWGAGTLHAVDAVVISGSGNGGFNGAGDATVVVTLQGSRDGSAWTDLRQWSFADAQTHNQQTLTV